MQLQITGFVCLSSIFADITNMIYMSVTESYWINMLLNIIYIILANSAPYAIQAVQGYQTVVGTVN